MRVKATKSIDYTGRLIIKDEYFAERGVASVNSFTTLHIGR